MKRIGVVGIVIEGNRDVAMEVQKILSENGDMILGRMENIQKFKKTLDNSKVFLLIISSNINIFYCFR